MPDITKCTNEECPLKETCYRYTVEPDEYQSYAKFEITKNGSCENYWYNLK